ncbi:hypothetical protein FJ936_06495 [Mesorhizobium sp. B2-4-13]|uniref:hypothetical protein n=1 Tax=Mesorhizobium sp. B2-4-13 TaxID=2589936 RepID=UPI00115158A0|nr:hypothetical protein [Mesorhizobium sp. B2-4-13]TPK86993.1 hypothetical protein FJ936_06495 [Mesorhizobium sp. B2-4-13]
MPTTVGKRPAITTKSALIDWLSSGVKGNEPQTQVPIPFIRYFDDLAHRFKERDVIIPADTGWFEDLHELFCSIIDHDETQLWSENVTL